MSHDSFQKGLRHASSNKVFCGNINIDTRSSQKLDSFFYKVIFESDYKKM